MRTKLFALILFCPMLAFAQIPEQPSNYITDAAGVLSDEEEEELNNKLKAFEDQTTNQIFVLLTGTSGTEDFMELSERTAEKWKIGQKGKDNGVLVAIFIDDRKLSIQVGYGLEGAIPDALTTDIRLNQMNPYLKEKEYYEAILHGTEALMKASRGEYTAQPLPEVLSQEEEIARNQRVGMQICVIVGLIFSGIIFLIFKNKFAKISGESETDQKDRKKLTRKAYLIGSVYVIFFLFVLNGYFGSLFGDFKKVLPIILLFPLFGFFVAHLLVLLLGLFDSSATATYSGSGRSRSWSGGSSWSSGSSSSFGGGGGGSFGGGGSGGSW